MINFYESKISFDSPINHSKNMMILSIIENYDMC